MAYSDFNKETQNGFVVKYTFTSKMVDLGHDTITGTSVHDWRVLYCVTRVATKTYSYKGLTEEDAKQCAADKIAKYTRHRKGWQLGEDHIEYVDCTYCGANCTPVHDAGHIWHCDIQVNERDDVWTFDTPSNPKSLFSYIYTDNPGYNYDDETEA